MRPIDADALLHYLRSTLSDLTEEDGAYEWAWVDAIHEIEHAPTVNGWVSVKDRLPEEETEYLCWFGDYPFGAFAMVCRWNKIKGAFWCYSDNTKWAFITHWMPVQVPEPPKDESAPARILTLDELRALPLGAVVWEEYRQDDGEMPHLCPTVVTMKGTLTNWYEQKIEMTGDLLRHDEAGFQVRYWSAEPDKHQMEGADWDE